MDALVPRFGGLGFLPPATLAHPSSSQDAQDRPSSLSVTLKKLLHFQHSRHPWRSLQQQAPQVGQHLRQISGETRSGGAIHNPVVVAQ